MKVRIKSGDFKGRIGVILQGLDDVLLVEIAETRELILIRSADMEMQQDED